MSSAQCGEERRNLRSSGTREYAFNKLHTILYDADLTKALP